MFNASGSGIMNNKEDKKSQKRHKEHKENGKPKHKSKDKHSQNSNFNKIQDSSVVPILKINLKELKSKIVERNQPHVPVPVKTEVPTSRKPSKPREERKYVKYFQEEVALENERISVGIAESVKMKMRNCRKDIKQDHDSSIEEDSYRDPTPPPPKKRKKNVVKTEKPKEIKVKTTPVQNVKFTSSPVSPSIPNYIIEYVKAELKKYQVMKWMDALIEEYLGMELAPSLLEANPFSKIPTGGCQIRRLTKFVVPISSIGQGLSNLYSAVGAFEEFPSHCVHPYTNEKRIQEKIHSPVVDTNKDLDLPQKSRSRHASTDSNSSRDSGIGSKPQSPNSDEDLRPHHNYALPPLSLSPSDAKKNLTSHLSKSYAFPKYLTHTNLSKAVENKLQSLKRGSYLEAQNDVSVQSEEHSKAKHERRVVHLGNLPSYFTKEYLKEKFQRFGKIEKIQIKSKNRSDDEVDHQSLPSQTLMSSTSTMKGPHGNCGKKYYGFITFEQFAVAQEVVAKEKQLCDWPGGSISFGGRREFVKDEYADFDSEANNSAVGRSYAQSQDGDIDYTLLLKREQEKRGLISTSKEIASSHS